MRSDAAGLALAFLLLVAPGLRAQEPSSGFDVDRLALSGSLRAGYWRSDRELTDRRNPTPASAWLKATPDLGGGFALRAEGWVADERPLNGGEKKAELREALVSWHGETLDLSAGRRIVTWGRADRINPTDLVGSRDYTLLFADDEEQRRGSLMATVSRTFGDYTATALWLPEFRPNVYPIIRPAGLSVDDEASRFNAAQAAFRLDHTAPGFDWALIWFNGLDRDPDARIDAIGPGGVSVRTRHRRLQAFGADFATTAEGFGLRGEVAYRIAAGRDPADVFDKGDSIAAVLGADRDLADGLNLNVQYLFKHVVDYADPRANPSPVAALIATRAALLNNQLERTQHGATLRLAYTALNDTLLLELGAAGFFTDGSYVVRPKASYALTDAVRLTAGIDYFVGDGESFFGQLHANRTLYLELRYGF